MSFEEAGHGQLYQISPTADYIQYVQTSPSNTASESYCAVCSCTVSDDCEIRLENVSIHVDCIDELVFHLDKVWNYSDEILWDTLQQQ